MCALGEITYEFYNTIERVIGLWINSTMYARRHLWIRLCSWYPVAPWVPKYNVSIYKMVINEIMQHGLKLILNNLFT